MTKSTKRFTAILLSIILCCLSVTHVLADNRLLLQTTVRFSYGWSSPVSVTPDANHKLYLTVNVIEGGSVNAQVYNSSGYVKTVSFTSGTSSQELVNNTNGGTYQVRFSTGVQAYIAFGVSQTVRY